MINNSYDIILVICGCLSSCVEHENLKCPKKLIISSDNHYTKAAEALCFNKR
jgi:hypothetical protein